MKAQIVVRFVVMLALLGCILMGAAGTVRFWQAWAFLALMGGGSIAMVVYLALRDPALLERRMRREEKRPMQKVFHYTVMSAWLLAFLLSGLDRRYGWSPVLPWWACALGLAAVAWGLAITFATLRANTFASATIELEKDQRVVSTGPYGIVRHPMYSGIVAIMAGMPIGLGSVAALAASAIMIAMLIIRLLDEEKLLRAELPGYAEYCARVKWRLAPGVY
ncbi:MAG TPA: isoprenylcysteine carboxylmethyltransferase family protein [Acidobacteriaceae bacterium]|nr:isoprenylcysteine carboxylmethyltransferase family protein [Acidobacteriaceae bacterium]